jgi:hypothetical protein
MGCCIYYELRRKWSQPIFEVLLRRFFSRNMGEISCTAMIIGLRAGNLYLHEDQMWTGTSRKCCLSWAVKRWSRFSDGVEEHPNHPFKRAAATSRRILPCKHTPRCVVLIKRLHVAKVYIPIPSNSIYCEQKFQPVTSRREIITLGRRLTTDFLSD